MKTFRNLFTNPWFIFAIVLYVISLLVLSRRTEFSISDTLTELLIFGIGFPILAWWATKRAKPLPIKVHATGGEMLAVVAYVLALSVYLAFGPQAIDSWLPQDWIASDRIRFFITLSKKLLVFVVVPLAIFGLIPILSRWRGSPSPGRQILEPTTSPRSAALFSVAHNRGRIGRRVFFLSVPSITPERVVPI